METAQVVGADVEEVRPLGRDGGSRGEAREVEDEVWLGGSHHGLNGSRVAKVGIENSRFS